MFHDRNSEKKKVANQDKIFFFDYLFHTLTIAHAILASTELYKETERNFSAQLLM